MYFSIFNKKEKEFMRTNEYRCKFKKLVNNHP
jgi:hypothetical protein